MLVDVAYALLRNVSARSWDPLAEAAHPYRSMILSGAKRKLLFFAHTAVISLRSCRFGSHGVAVDVRADELFCTPVDRQLTARSQFRAAVQLEERAAGGATHHAQENDDERF
jgi:hypothetical protein